MILYLFISCQKRFEKNYERIKKNDEFIKL